eukprot:3104268-Rhodomonas_salina.1
MGSARWQVMHVGADARGDVAPNSRPAPLHAVDHDGSRRWRLWFGLTWCCAVTATPSSRPSLTRCSPRPGPNSPRFSHPALLRAQPCSLLSFFQRTVSRAIHPPSRSCAHCESLT